MKRRNLFGFAAALALPALPLLAAGRQPEVQLFKNAACGCCGSWAAQMEAAGFRVKTTIVDDTGPARHRAGIPDALASCHTAVVGDYALEGHVPPAEVKRLLAMKPAAAGLAVPGMPQSAPGMNVPGARDPYDVLLVDRQGRTRVFASYPKA